MSCGDESNIDNRRSDSAILLSVKEVYVKQSIDTISADEDNYTRS